MRTRIIFIGFFASIIILISLFMFNFIENTIQLDKPKLTNENMVYENNDLEIKLPEVTNFASIKKSNNINTNDAIQQEQLITDFARLLEFNIQDADIEFLIDYERGSENIVKLETEDSRLIIDLDYKTVLFYDFVELMIPLDLKREDGITKTEAKEKINEILKGLNIIDRVSGDDLKYADRVNSIEDLRGAVWKMRKPFKRLTIPIMGQGIAMDISAYSNKPVFISHYPKPLETSLEADMNLSIPDRISEEMAAQVANEFLYNVSKGGELPDIVTKKMVFLDSNFYQNIDVYPERDSRLQLTWAVAYTINGAANMTLFVDAYSGEIVGDIGLIKKKLM